MAARRRLSARPFASLPSAVTKRGEGSSRSRDRRANFHRSREGRVTKLRKLKLTETKMRRLIGAERISVVLVSGR